MREGFKNCSFRGNSEDWEYYKALCKEQDSDASKQIRKFIKQTLELNQEKIEVYKRLKNAKQR